MNFFLKKHVYMPYGAILNMLFCYLKLKGKSVTLKDIQYSLMGKVRPPEGKINTPRRAASSPQRENR